MAKYRLKKAKLLGADFVYRVKKEDKSEEEMVKDIKNLIGVDPNVTLECTGDEQSMRVALNVICGYSNF